MRNYRRDLIGHFIRSRQREQQSCTHACCRGHRVHPSNYPVILPDRTLRRASDEDLAEHYRKVSREDTPETEAARDQILYEMDRRDRAETERQARRQAYAQRLFSQRLEREEAVEHAFVQAEAATNGYMLNRAGRDAGVNERALFTGPESRARRYASEELLNHWQAHPRPTAAMFRGEDTRLGVQYTAPKRKRYGAAPARTTVVRSHRHPNTYAVITETRR